MDFTLTVYKQMLLAFQEAGYRFYRLRDFLESGGLDAVAGDEKFLILRHDVDRIPANSLATAKLEKELGIKAGYYFRIVDESFHPHIVEAIAALDHEIGYHYEDLSLAEGEFERALFFFETHLQELRRYYPIKTICMHGRPLSKWDNRLLWEKYDYKQFGIIGEPYFDLDFNALFYITDTGRRWDNRTSNVRDKVTSSGFDVTYRRTADIIAALENNTFPPRAMMNTHPERWTDALPLWIRQLVLQKAKNLVKRILVNVKR